MHSFLRSSQVIWYSSDFWCVDGLCPGGCFYVLSRKYFCSSGYYDIWGFDTDDFCTVYFTAISRCEEIGVSALTILLGFFSGPVIFGAKGLLLGPILLVITETIIVEYMRYRISGHENFVPEKES